MLGHTPPSRPEARRTPLAALVLLALLASLLTLPFVGLAPARAVGAVPDPPTAVTARAGNATAKVTWAAPLFTDGQTITGYAVTSSPGSVQCTTSGSPAATSCTVTGLANSTAYTFTVTATTANGTSSPSTASTAVTPLSGTPGVNYIGTNGSVKWSDTTVGWGTEGTYQAANFPGTIYNSSSPGTTLGGTLSAATVNESMCSSSWFWYQILCDPGVGKDLATTMTPGSSAAGITWISGSPAATTRGWVIVDLGAVRSFTTLRLFQMFSDGKTTDIRMSLSSNGTATWPAYGDGTWTTVAPKQGVDAGKTTGGVLSCPTIVDIGAHQARYLLLEMWNAGQFGSTGYIELAGAKLFFEDEPAAAGSGCSPAPPTGVTAIAGNGTARVSWSAAVSADPITGYALQYSTNGGSSWSSATTSPTPVSGAATSTTVTGLSNGASYVFRVSATNAAGTSPYSTPSNAVTPSGVPNPPTNATAVAGEASAAVSWTAPASGPTPTGYTVTSSPDARTCTTAVTSCSVTGLRNTVSYTFAVVATNGSGSSLPATTSAVTPVAALTPTTANFGSQPVPGGATDPITFTYNNRTGSAVTVDSPGIYVLGESAASFSIRPGTTCANGATIASGDTCEILVAFDPSSTGAKAATLTMARSDATSTVDLAGTGTLGVQTVTWTPTTTVTAAMSPMPSTTATTNGNGTIAYAVTSAGTTGCAVDSSTGALTFTATGECAVQVTASATSTYAAGSVSVTFTVARASQTITLIPGTAQSVLERATVDLGAAGYSGSGAVTYDVASGAGSCSITGSTLTATDAGACTVTATIAQDALYAAATSAAVTFTVNSRTQVVTWAPTNTSVVVTAAPLTPNALASTSGDGAISYTVASAGTTGCAVDSVTGVLTFSTAGTCRARATAAETATYASATKDVDFTVAAVVPGTPVITGASGGDTEATVTFTAPAFSGGASVTSYVVTGSPSGSVACATIGSPMSCTVTGLTNGTAYTFTVAALNAAGTGAGSAASPSVTPVTAPTAPTALTLYPGDGTIDLGWTAPSCLTGAACGTFVNWIVEYRPTGSGPWTTAATLTDQATTGHRITGLDNGTAYEVQVTLTTSVDAASATGSEVPATTPSAPQTASAVKVGASSATLSWSAPASNGGTAITTYEVVSGAVAFAGCTTSPCTITGLTSGETYTFAVAARNRMGLGPTASALPVTMGAVAQTITVVPSSTSGPVFGEITLSSSGSSGSGARTFALASGEGTVCSIAGAVVSALATGTCSVAGSIAADALYSAATSQPVALTIVKAVQQVIWTPTDSFLMSQTPATLQAATTDPAGAGPLSYSVAAAGTAGCDIAAGRALTFTSAGTCLVRASAAATADYEAAASDVIITVALATRTVAWEPVVALTAQSLGDPLAPGPSVSAGSATYSYSIDDSGTAGCTVDATTGDLDFTSAGTCSVRATAAATAVYGSAGTAVTVTVSTAPQSIGVVPSATSAVVAAEVTLASTGSSGSGAITYAVPADDAAICSVSGDAVTAVSAGTCRVTAEIAADPLYDGATSAPASIAVSAAPQTVDWAPTRSLVTTQSPYAPSPYATSTGSGTITYRVTDPGATGCTIDPTTALLSFAASGTCEVTATAAAVLSMWLEGAMTVTFTISQPVVPNGGGSAGPSIQTVDARGSLDPIPANGGLAPGQDKVTVAGRPVAAAVTALPGNDGVEISGSGWSVVLSVSMSDASPVPLGASGTVILASGTVLTVRGRGLEPGSPVRVYLLSDPLLLTEATADASGRFDTRVHMPDSVAVGPHTVQVNSFDDGGRVRSVNVGVEVVAETARPAAIGSRVYFPYLSSTLTPKARQALRSLVRQAVDLQAESTVVIGVVRERGASPSDWALAHARAANVSSFLVRVGLPGDVVVKARKAHVHNTRQARRVSVTVHFGA